MAAGSGVAAPGLSSASSGPELENGPAAPVRLQPASTSTRQASRLLLRLA